MATPASWPTPASGQPPAPGNLLIRRKIVDVGEYRFEIDGYSFNLIDHVSIPFLRVCLGPNWILISYLNTGGDGRHPPLS